MRQYLAIFLVTVQLSLISIACYGADEKYILQNSNNTRIAIFVHGFTCDYLKTWGKLPDLLQADASLDQYDFFFWGYPSRLFGQNENIGSTGKYLKSNIDYRLNRYQDVVLIGHSMGGLVIRSYIIQSLIDGKGNDLNNIADVLLFGVPNDGDLKPEAIPKWVNDQIADVGVASKFITELRKYWIQRVTTAPRNDDFHRQIPTLAVAGYQDHFLRQESVESFFRDTAMTDGNHLSMVKPESASHLTCRIIQKRLVEAAKYITRSEGRCGEQPSSGYSCQAEVVSSRGANLVTTVREFPGASQAGEPISVGTKLLITSAYGNYDRWYQIQNLDGVVLGWIPKANIQLSTTCPN